MVQKMIAIMFLLSLATLSNTVDARPPPAVKHIMLEVAAAPKTSFDSDINPADLSQLTCSEAKLYVADVEERFATLPLDLEKVCISLRGAMKAGFRKCPEFKPIGTFAKLFKVCKVVTNNGLLTCSVGSDCGSAGSML